MRFTRQQRINNIASQMIEEMNAVCVKYRDFLTKGVDAPGIGGYESLKCTGEEVRAALGENAKKLDIVFNFVLEGKSNKITKGR